MYIVELLDLIRAPMVLASPTGEILFANGAAAPVGTGHGRNVWELRAFAAMQAFFTTEQGKSELPKGVLVQRLGGIFCLMVVEHRPLPATSGTDDASDRVSEAAHRVRNDLGTVLINVDLLTGPPPLASAEIVEISSELRDAAHRLAFRVETLLDAAAALPYRSA